VSDSIIRIELTVRAHEGADVRFDTGLERSQVVLYEVLLRNLDIVLISQVTIPVLNIVSSEMLARGYHALIGVTCVTLKPLDKGFDIRGEVIGIFSRCLLTTAPTRVPERVDVLLIDQPTTHQINAGGPTGVQKSRPVRFALLKALASVEMTFATSVMRASSNAAPIRMG
jgi:hypothetical protein